MADDKPGPQRGSAGARRIAEAHRGSHEHDREGGFAANPALAREAGRKGGEMRGVRAAEARASQPQPEPAAPRKRGRPRKNPAE
jgi:general stress protein YciG